MSAYALVSPQGAILDERAFDEAPPTTLATGKPRWLPIVEVNAAFDPVSQVRTGPMNTVEAARVLRTYTVRAKNEDEVGAMIAAKIDGLEAEYRRRNSLPFAAEVDGVERTWHGDDEGMGNIQGINILIARDPALVPNPRPWKPYEADIVMVSHDGFTEIGAAYAARKDVNFTILQTRKATLRAMTNPTLIYAFDPLAGWD